MMVSNDMIQPAMSVAPKPVPARVSDMEVM